MLKTISMPDWVAKELEELALATELSENLILILALQHLFVADGDPWRDLEPGTKKLVERHLQNLKHRR